MSQALLIPGLGRLNLQRLLFGANEVGGIWDWSDRSTMFQDNQGANPITASGQTRGLHLDKSRGLIRGAELVTNGDFSNGATGWAASGPVGFSVVSGQAVVARNDGAIGNFPSQNVGMVSGRWYEITVDVIARSNNVSIYLGTPSASNEALFTSSGLGQKRIIAATGASVFFGPTGGTSATCTIDNISVRELPGNHRYQANLSNRPQYVQDATGHYGLYDGVDDWDETNAVNFTGTDKMTVWWGGRKLTEAVNGAILELSTNSTLTNAFSFFAPTGAASNSINTLYRGSGPFVSNSAANSLPSPINAVVTAAWDIAAPLSIQRVNGLQTAITTSSPGTGNFGNHKLFFGRRNGVSDPANIREYMTIIRGAQTPTNIIERVERFVGKKVGISW